MVALVIEKLIGLIVSLLLTAGFRSIQWVAQTVMG